MSVAGYIKLYRSIKEQPWYQDSEAVHLFMHLLIEASHTQREYIVKGELMTLKPGQFLTGRKQLAVNTGINESKVQRLLKLFENCGQIEQQTNNLNRCISVLNWHKYQGSEQPANNQRTTSEQPANNQRTQNKNDNNYKNENNEKKTTSPIETEPYASWLSQIADDDLFREQVARQHRLFDAEFDNMLENFLHHKAAVGELNHRSYSDFRKNFLFWIPKNLEQKSKSNASNGKTRNHSNLIDEATARRVFEKVTAKDR